MPEVEEGTTPVAEAEGEGDAQPGPPVWMNYLHSPSSDDSDSAEDDDVCEELKLLREK